MLIFVVVYPETFGLNLSLVRIFFSVQIAEHFMVITLQPFKFTWAVLVIYASRDQPRKLKCI